MEINKLLTPFNFNDGKNRRIRYLVIHYVGALGGAKANCEYYASRYVGASAHYFVGFQGEIWQAVEDVNIAWHCGAKSYRHPECRNSNSIGIELCVRNKGSREDVSRSWYFEDETVKAAVLLAKELMKRYEIPAERVIRHYDVTGKICPNPFVYNHTSHTWDGFKSALHAPEPGFTGGWEKDGGNRFRYLGGSQKFAKDEWLLINHHWYLFGRDGYMLTGWQKWNKTVTGPEDPGDWYFFDNTAGGPLEGACWHTKENGAQEIWYVE